MRDSSLAFLHEGSATWRSSASALASRETPAHTLMFHRIFPLIHCVTTTRFLLDSLFEAFWRRFLRGHLYDPPQASSPGFQTETRRDESTARLSAFFLFGNSSSLFLHPFALFSDALASTLFEGFRSFLPFLPYTIHFYLCYTVTSLIERPKHSLIYFVNLQKSPSNINELGIGQLSIRKLCRRNIGILQMNRTKIGTFKPRIAHFHIQEFRLAKIC
jgi:hypothetical protein